MADLKISALTASTTPLAGTEVLPIVQSSTTKQVSVANLTAGRAVSAAQLDVDNLRLDGNTVSSTSTNGDIYLTPNGTGKVAVGAVAPADNFSVEGTIRAASGTNHARYANNFLRSVTTGTYFFDQFTVGQSFVYRVSSASALDTTAMTVASTGNVTLDTGNLVIGTSGKGIDFSATAGTGTSELLADYEEGTWTPGNGTNSTVNSVSSAFYTKVGRIVNAYAYFNVTTTSASITITGLPFNCTGFGPAYIYFAAAPLLPFTGGSYVEASAAYVNLNVGAIGTAAIMVSVSYMV